MVANEPVDDQLLKQYLLGAVPQEEAECLDELGISDDHVASHLRAAEYDLIDSYVRGELSGDALQRFRAAYLGSPERRRRVQIAEALAAHAAGKAAVRPRRWRPHGDRALAAAAIVAVAIAAVGFVALRKHATVPPRVVAQRTAPAAPAPHVATAPPQNGAAIVSFVLAPPRRGGMEVPSLAVPSNARAVAVRLQLESDDFPEYRAALRDLSTDEIVWSSRRVQGTSAVSIEIPASVLKRRTYSVDLSGLPARAPAEPIGSYAFRVIR